MTSRFDLAGRVAVVTGACGKLGPVWVDALVEAGARVAALDLPSAVPSSGFAEVVARAGPAVVRLDCDVTDRASIEAAAHAVLAQLGAPAVLVSAGVGSSALVCTPPELDVPVRVVLLPVSLLPPSLATSGPHAVAHRTSTETPPDRTQPW